MQALRLVAAAMTSMAGIATAQTVRIIEPIRPNANLRATAVSADGRVVCGTSAGTGAFMWTPEAGTVDLAPGLYGAACVSSDGRVIAGGPAYWPAGPGEPINVGVLPGHLYYSFIRAVSGDGEIAVGYSTDQWSIEKQAFIWTREAGLHAFAPVWSTANGISDDGSTVVGSSSYGAATVWREGVAEALPLLPNDAGHAEALAVSRDGSVIIGRSGLSGEGALWRNGTVISLGRMESFEPADLTDAGDLVVGTARDSRLLRVAVVWTPERGLGLLSDYFASRGIFMPVGYSLSECTAVSAEGATFVGVALNADGGQRGYVITIPSPSVLAVLAVAGAFTRRRPRA